MSHSVKITTPIPSPEDVAFSLGVSRARLDELLALVDRDTKGRRSGNVPGFKRSATKRAFKKASVPTRRVIEKRGQPSR